MGKKAFSLIELSIVILIIGILVAGVTQSSRLIKQFRLQTAQNLTTSSPVVSIQNLVAWYETSLEKSFISSETVDGGNLTTWYDINPQATSKSHSTQSTTSDQPKYTENVFNGGAIPAVRFDGSADFMSFDGTMVVNTDYTIFVVEQRTSNKDYNYFMGGNSENDDEDLHIGYRSNTQVRHDHYGSAMNYDLAGYSSPTPRTHTFWFSKTSGKKYFMNGGTTPEISNALQTSALTTYPGSKIGRYTATATTRYYQGDMAEIIVFNRALKNEERQSIETYLGKKYGITIS